MGPTHAHDYKVGGSDKTEDLAGYVAVFEAAKATPKEDGSGTVDARAWLLEMVEFGSADVAVAVWRENEEGVRAPWTPTGEEEIRNRAIRAETRREMASA